MEWPFSSFPSLETQRLRLRKLEPSDASAIYALFSDPEVTRYYDLEKFTEIEQAADLLERFQRRYTGGIGIRWALELSDDPGHLIGTCGYNLWLRDSRRGLIGYDLASRHWNRGLMSEALTAVLNFGFSSLDLNRAEALAFEANAASRRLLEKQNFRCEGVLREYQFVRGQAVDMALYALLRRQALLPSEEKA
jgi:[ribosomal protein S5]-alanine N-acetyltransferase